MVNLKGSDKGTALILSQGWIFQRGGIPASVEKAITIATTATVIAIQTIEIYSEEGKLRGE